MTRPRVLLAIAVLVLLVAACGHGTGAPERTAAPKPSLTDLRDIAQLRSLFNARAGEPRLIILVSPT
jgi:hypothetical protein